MASSFTSSSTPTRWIYDVFLSFRGETRRGFTSHLLNALIRMGIHAFMDDAGIERGGHISASLLQALEGSRIAIIILSPDYASSKWCLDELEVIMELQRSQALVVIPIFYNVDPSDVLHQSGSYGEAMEIHEQRWGRESDQVLRWREALTEIANIQGFCYSACQYRKDGPESKLIENIVEDVSRKLGVGDLFIVENDVGTKPQGHHELKDKWFKYDVFLSFRGEDTGHGFTSHLYNTLTRSGYHTFMDDTGTERGEEISCSFLQAIERSRIALVIFSSDYASSKRCLEELEKIIECYTTHGLVVVPLFYNVYPSDIRGQRGSYGEAMEQHKRRFGWGSDQVLRWRNALMDAASMAGFISSAYRHDSQLVEIIVEDISKKLYIRELLVADHPVGLEPQVDELIIEMSTKISSKALIIGLWGMGGIGKTTVAKAIYNHIGCHHFEARSFIANIRENSKHANDLVNLQKKLIFDITETQVFKIPNIERGKNIIRERFPNIRAFVVLDDVDSVNQLNALCESHQWFSPRSVIIITTRDLYLLDVLKADYKYRMREMDEIESLKLFSWHAFEQETPLKNFIELSKNVVAYCGGLPLALKTLGSCLHGRTTIEWKAELSKLQRIPNKDIQANLKISYDGLNAVEKDIFLDICCFFINKERNYVAQILDGCDFLAKNHGLQILIERSLVKVGADNKLEMHDLLQKMGKEIIRERAPKISEGRSRLWLCKDILDVLTEYMGTKAVEGISLKVPTLLGRKCLVDCKAFKKMPALRLLQLYNVDLKGDYSHISRKLSWLCWHGFPLKYTPNNLCQERLVAIDFKYSNLKLVWKEPQLLLRLKTLKLSHSRNLTQTPDFTKLPNLERLVMKDCPSLIFIHEGIGDLRNLLHVNLKDCRSLRQLPRSIYKLKSLKALILSGCSLIDHLEEDFEQMESLTTLKANNTAVTQVPKSLARLKGLKQGCVSFPGLEGRAQDIFPSLIWSWMSPNNIPQCHVEEFAQSISSLAFSVGHNGGFRGLSPFLGDLVKLRGMWDKCRSQFRFHGTRASLLNALYQKNFMELESTRDTPQISYMEESMSCGVHDQLYIARPADSFNSLILQLGVCDKADLLKERISQGWKYVRGDDSHLPGVEYPDCFIYKGEGHSVILKVPQVRGCHLKAMLLNIVYSTHMDITRPQFLINVLIINYTKATVIQHKGDSVTLNEDAEWQGTISSVQPGDFVEIVVSIPQCPVKKIATYLIYDDSKRRKLLKSLSQKLISVCHIASVLLICAAIFRKGK